MYPNSVVFIKSGSFYNTYYEDAVFMYELFGYKLIDKKVGFPKYIINKMAILDSYVVVDNYSLRVISNYF